MQGEKLVNDSDLLEMREFLTDLRFIQANTLVSAGLQDNKQAIAYMKRIARLSGIIDARLKEKNT